MIEHEYDRSLSGVELVQHMSTHHGFHSSNEFENDSENHRIAHGAPTLREERIQQLHWRAFCEPSTAEGWAVGDPDGWWVGGLLRSQAIAIANEHNEALDKTF